MNAVLIALAVHAASADARAFARCADVSRKVDICREGRGVLLFAMGGYPTRIGFDDGRKKGGVTCQPGTSELCEWTPAILERRPAAWPVMETEVRGHYRYCLTKRPVRGHLPIGCLTLARDLTFRRVDFDRDF